MTRRDRLVLSGVIGAAALVVGSAVLWLGGSSGSERLGDAELLADGGEVSLSEVMRGDKAWRSLDDPPISAASSVASGGDGAFYVLLEDQLRGALVEASAAGRVERAGLVNFGEPRGVHLGPRITGLGIAPDGGMAVAYGAQVLLRGFNWTGDDAMEARFQVGAIAWAEDGSVLLGSIDDPVIDAVGPDGTVRRLLGPPADPEAEVRAEEPLGSIVSLLALDGGRVVFVADTSGGYRLYVLEGQEARPVEVEGQSPVERLNPVASEGARPADESVRADRLPMEPIAPGPDGRVLATGIGAAGDPEISVVDLSSGEVEVLAELEGVEPTIDQPVSAVAVGDDLVFLAEDKVWKLEGAFA